MADPGRAVILVAALADEMRPVVAALRQAGVKPAAVCQTGVGAGAATAAVCGVLERWIGPLNGIIHLGFAGGLDPALTRGAVVRFGWVTDAQGDKIVLDETLSQGLLTLPDALREPADKRRWFDQTGAGAVDQETHALAAIARERGLARRGGGKALAAAVLEELQNTEPPE